MPGAQVGSLVGELRSYMPEVYISYIYDIYVIYICISHMYQKNASSSGLKYIIFLKSLLNSLFLNGKSLDGFFH